MTTQVDTAKTSMTRFSSFGRSTAVQTCVVKNCQRKIGDYDHRESTDKTRKAAWPDHISELYDEVFASKRSTPNKSSQKRSEKTTLLTNRHLLLTSPSQRSEPGGSANEPLARLPGRVGRGRLGLSRRGCPSPATLSRADPPQTAFGEGEDDGDQREVSKKRLVSDFTQRRFPTCFCDRTGGPANDCPWNNPNMSHDSRSHIVMLCSR